MNQKSNPKKEANEMPKKTANAKRAEPKGAAAKKARAEKVEEQAPSPSPSQPTGTYKTIIDAAEKVLHSGGHTSEEHSIGAQEIYDKVIKDDSEFGVPLTTFRQGISRAIKERTSRIYKRQGHHGYFLGALAAGVESEQAKPESAAEKKERQKENKLYEVLKDWLIQQRYRARVVDSTRANGMWGNPDIAGIHTVSDITGISIEITTIEAKTTEDQWRKWFFEAVSHRRFANRSYFAFAHPEGQLDKLDPELRYYSELFGVGVLIVAINKTKYDDLNAGQITQPLAMDDVDIIEHYSAPFNFVQPRFQKPFIESLGIKDILEVAKWGEGVEDGE